MILRMKVSKQQSGGDKSFSVIKEGFCFPLKEGSCAKSMFE